MIKEGDFVKIKKIVRWYDELEKYYPTVPEGEFEEMIIECNGKEYLIKGGCGKGSLAGDPGVDNGISIKPAIL